MSTSNAITDRATDTLRSAIAGDVYVPGDDSYDQACRAWNLFTDQRPAAVVFADSARALRRDPQAMLRCAGNGRRPGDLAREALTSGGEIVTSTDVVAPVTECGPEAGNPALRAIPGAQRRRPGTESARLAKARRQETFAPNSQLRVTEAGDAPVPA
jgi:hypothetical protein